MELNFDPFSWISLSIIISVIVIIIFLFVIKSEKFKSKADYRTLFIIGCGWIPIGLATEIWPLTIVGVALAIYGGLNRKKWAKQVTWKELPEGKRRLKIGLIIGFTLIFVAGGIVYWVYDSPDYSVAIVDELEAIYPDSNINASDTLLIIDIPKGSFAAAHLLLSTSDTGKIIRFKVKGIPAGYEQSPSWYRLLEVPVSENTGLDSRTEKFSGQTNPYVIRKAPFFIYEVLKPVEQKITMDSLSFAMRFELAIDSSFPAGSHELELVITSGFQHKTISILLNVYDVKLPAFGDSSMKYVNWHSINRISSDHQLEKWSDEFWTVLSTYAEMMAKGRQNTFWFHWAEFFDFDSVGMVSNYDEARLEKYIQTFLDAGLSTIQGAPFTRRIDWSTDGMLVSLPALDDLQIHTSSESGETIIATMFRSVLGTIEKNAWTEMWYQGIFDEPTDQYVDRYKQVADLLYSIKPDLRILEATMTTSLSGIVNCWCPQVHEYQANIDFFNERKAAGDDVWVYTCLVPGGPWINRLVDQERLRPVLVAWSVARFDLDGFLHWGFNHHRGKPFTELVVLHGGPKNYLPAGDSHIVYPGGKEPWSSQRFEAHRIGMEDYDLIKMLEEKKPDIANTLVLELFRAFDDYEKDIGKYREVKKRLLQELD